MELKQIRMQNIRSYKESTINFPLGSVLLSGDIGSGKSSILHAIDFALFGIRKGDLSGSSLLRNGERNGFVELLFIVDGKEVLIKRTLKKQQDTVVQDSGVIIQDGKKQELSPIELKQKIIELLNYPKEYLTKSKSLIYHYTVYTPQEEVKQILLGEKDLRINTLRKIFGIDKYQRILDNTKIVLTLFREKKKLLEGMTSELDIKTQLHIGLLEKKQVLDTELEGLLEKLNQSSELLEEKQNQIKDIEQQIKEYTRDMLELDLVNTKIDYLKKQINILEQNISLLSVEDIALKETDTKPIFESLKQNTIEQSQNQKLLEELNYNITKLEIEKQSSQELLNNFESLHKCPVCMQDVPKGHKDQILLPHKALIQKNKDLLQDLLQKQLDFKKSYQELKQKETLFLDELRNTELQNLKIKTSLQKKSQKELLEKNLIQTNNSVSSLEINKKELEQKVLNNKEIEITYNIQTSHLQNIQKIQRELEIKYSTHKATIQNIISQIENLQTELHKLHKIKQKISKLQNIYDFLETDFANIVSDIEKNVMLRVHHDFSSLFERWFGVLVDPQALQVNLDEEFSPVIEQNGYQIEYEYLSGGEKTSVALAYRLALNQVINNLLSTIKTKDLIILDEPTDGFSSEQLDRLRVLFEELNIKQTILVSHEPKIESFVQTVIRLSKKDHTTTIA